MQVGRKVVTKEERKPKGLKKMFKKAKRTHLLWFAGNGEQIIRVAHKRIVSDRK